MELGYVKEGRPDYRRFALERGYDPGYVWRWINGKSAPSLEAARQLIGDLGVSLSWLLLGEEPETSPARPRAPRRRPAPIAGGSSAPAPIPVSGPGERTASYQTLGGLPIVAWRGALALLEAIFPARGDFPGTGYALSLGMR